MVRYTSHLRLGHKFEFADTTIEWKVENSYYRLSAILLTSLVPFISIISTESKFDTFRNASGLIKRGDFL